MENQNYKVLDEKILQYLPERIPNSHKGTYGKVLCIAGSKNMAGAAYFCAYAAYRTGAGLVRILTPEENRIILQGLIPEAVLTSFDRKQLDCEIINEALAWADVVAIGPGLGKEPWVREILKFTMKNFQKPLVVDADGLNCLAADITLLEEHIGPVILTPHLGEFSRLCNNKSIQEISKNVPEEAAQFARQHSCILVLKSAPTAIGTGEKEKQCYVNTTGNNGMSTGGSGDVLTGIIVGLLSQKVSPLQAALLGVWLHGRAGDLAVEQEGYYGMMARHLIEYLPRAMDSKGDIKR